VQAGQLVLDGATLAAIYLGDITKWNDPRIKKLNPKLSLPRHRDHPDLPLRRLRDQLSCSPTTCRSRAEVPADRGRQQLGAVAVGIGAKGNEGVANMTHQTDGAIGYVEYAYAKPDQHGVLRSHQQGGQDGSFPAPRRSRRRPRTPTGPMTALSPDPHRSARREKAGPITGVSFILVYAEPPDPGATAEALKFFDWAYNNVPRWRPELDYVPLPPSLIQQVRTTWQKEVKGAPGLASAAADGKRM